MAIRKSVWLFALVTLTLLGGLGAYLGFRIQTITCDLENQPCPPEVATLFQPLGGQSIFFFDDQVLTTVLQSNPSFQISSYSLRLPNTLVLHLKPQTVAYVIRSETETNSWAVTQEGHLIPQNTEVNSVQVLVPNSLWSQLQNQKSLDPQLHQVLIQTIQELQIANINVPVIYWQDSQTLALFLPGRPTILLDPTQPKEGVARIKSVLAEVELNPISASVQEIDVRYKLPVLRTNTSIPRHTSY